ncbi:hypothetical protein B9Z19DRAFT_31768 [Tuber borchii]|uniref:Uncharacterized protein n=1 Tax=Tuber borchii TaxID=42251 RepID=A0A2T6ZTN1_TUBBO|nr:hypothetical protein B9Z19DRAFT_31768 [Tuber borchii]
MSFSRKEIHSSSASSGFSPDRVYDFLSLLCSFTLLQAIIGRAVLPASCPLFHSAASSSSLSLWFLACSGCVLYWCSICELV